VNKRGAYIPFIVYAIGLALTAWYVFGTRYLAFPDAVREYELYQIMRTTDYWTIFNYAHKTAAWYFLQSSCLFTTYIPAKISLVLPISPELFYKTYATLILPITPVIVYLIAKKYASRVNSFVAAIFMMSWVSFIDGASTARTGVALVFYSLALLLALGKSGNKYLRYGALVLVSIFIPLAHYGVALVSLAIIFGVLILSIPVRKAAWTYRRPLLISGVFILIVTSIWCVGISKVVNPFGTAKHISTSMSENATTSNLETITTTAATTGNTTLYVSSGGAMWMPDLPTRAALGIRNTDGSPLTWYNYALLLIAWVTVMLVAYGIFRSIKKRELSPEIKAMGVVSFAICAVFFLFQPLARGYGVERVYLQALVILGLFLPYGIEKIVKRVNVPPWVFSLSLVVVYGVMMKIYELTHSIIEKAS
jgi:hypothetical protein